jgi:Zn-dependent protease
MLLEPTRTPYDLNFQLFGTPVRVSPWFWLMSAILGWTWSDLGIHFVLLWIACVFISILLHEFGHIWAGKAFGSDGYIVLYSFGGLAIGASDLRHRWQRIVVSLAGPGIQLALWAGLYFGHRQMSLEQREAMPHGVEVFLFMMLWVNLYWPLFNLLPVWPLDGGKISRELCTAMSPNGVRTSLGLSIAVAAFIAAHAFLATPDRQIPYLPRGMFVGILFAMLAFESYQLLQQSRFLHYEPPDDSLPWER